MNKKKKVLIVVGCIVAVLVVVLIWKRNLVNMLVQEVLSPTLEMDTSEWTGGNSYENLQYSAVSENDYLHLYVPDADEPMPLFVLVHGGGFISNDLDSRQAQFMYRYFRQNGYACATINYRLADEAPFPGALEDVKAAVRFLRANAQNYGYDADRIAIWGESAGGYLANMAALTNDDEFMGVPFIGEDELEEPVSASVSALVDFYGAVDFDFHYSDYAELGIPKFIIDFANSWANGHIGEFESCHEYWLRKHAADMTALELDEINARYYVAENFNSDSDMHIMIRHGDADMSVALTQSERFYETCSSVLGADKVTLVVKENCKHADDRMYTDEELGDIKEWLDDIFSQN